MTQVQRQSKRRGVIVPLTGLLLIFLIGMVAFAVDIGWITVSEANLQNAADSAALAGAHPLMDGSVQYQVSEGDPLLQASILNKTLANCRAAAKQYASLNSAGAVKSLVLNDSDIQFGFTDQSGKFTAGTSPFPNTVKVTMRLDDQAN